ncbi:MAG: orotidine-5'-phosphate decarboxylase [Solirubrobacteraceae bacterium]|nr:orotidine-5'-phosphate decarboxylase [Solirubrobacteraceae bacterium]
MTSFADRLAERVAARSSQIVLGLDPDPTKLWPSALEAAPAGGAPAERAATAVAAHCTAVIDAAGEACVAIKPQLACFERLGALGWAALETVTRHAHAAGLLVIADGKRGDIDVTARAYGQALFGPVETPFGQLPGLQADAITANPLMGRDTLEPLIAAGRAAAGGVFVLVRTSNPGARDVEDVRTSDGTPLWERLAEIVADEGLVGEHGLADVGAVCGATQPEHLERLRDLMPRAPFLLPGVGAQGGRVEDLLPAFAPGPAGGLIAASRSIAAAHEQTGEDPASAARAAAESLRAAAWALV